MRGGGGKERGAPLAQSLIVCVEYGMETNDKKTKTVHIVTIIDDINTNVEGTFRTSRPISLFWQSQELLRRSIEPERKSISSIAMYIQCSIMNVKDEHTQ